jgi:hypothetical protein
MVFPPLDNVTLQWVRLRASPAEKPVQPNSQQVTPSIIALVKTPPLHCMLLVL